MSIPHDMPPTGITGMTRGLCRLQTPPNVPVGEVWRYGLGYPFQLSPTRAGILANIHRKLARIYDYEIGTDLLIFDDPRCLIADQAIPLARNHQETNLHAGMPADMVKYPVVGGFVPLGARRADGTPHPHAGTGFGAFVAIAFVIDDGDLSKPYPGPFSDREWYSYLEVQQYAYDGETFRITATERLAPDVQLSGFTLINPPMRMAIPDGDDLLLTFDITPTGVSVQEAYIGPQMSSGITRWQRRDEKWQPVSLTKVTGELPTIEPTLIRDPDGSLLFSARPYWQHEHGRSIVVWRSRDNGISWEQIIALKHLRQASPVSLNQAADGTPYIACNQSLSAFIDYQGQIADGDHGGFREILAAWPLNTERNGLKSPFIVRCPRYEFGPPADGRDWTIDHPNATTVRLADGRWHNLLCYRLLAQAEVTGGLPPTPHSGLCVEEIFSAGPERGEWRF